jgi:hypothetical protein
LDGTTSDRERWVVGGHLGTDGTTWTHIAPLRYLQTAADR